jgi:RNA polymerase sigma-70 factor, ECF subfamily
MEGDALARGTAEAVARRSYGKLVAFLAARTRDVAGAEDALSDAFAAALLNWPEHGVPDNPEAWLLTAARRRTVDASRHKRRSDEASDHLKLMAEELAGANDNAMPDQRLALMFACAHPAIDASIRAPLILQTVLGFDAAAIASAFLVAPLRWASVWCAPRRKSARREFPFAYPRRTSCAIA